jgi:hypothetical protein
VLKNTLAFIAGVKRYKKNLIINKTAPRGNLKLRSHTLRPPKILKIAFITTANQYGVINITATTERLFVFIWTLKQLITPIVAKL